MTVTPAALTQAESESTGVQVTVTPAEEAVVTEAPKEETAPAQEEKAETSLSYTRLYTGSALPRN